MLCKRSVDIDLGIGGILSDDGSDLSSDGNLSLDRDLRREVKEGLRGKIVSAVDFCRNALSGLRVFLLRTVPFLDGDFADSGASLFSTVLSVCSNFGGHRESPDA